MKNALVNLVNISKSFDNQMVLDDLNLYIRENEFLTLLGPSGCGKTTTLRILGGFETPDKGQVIFEGRDITNLPPNKRNLNTVFQKYALFPHMTIAENIAFGLKISGKSKSYINDKIKYALKLVNLDGFENRMPDSLSGGRRPQLHPPYPGFLKGRSAATYRHRPCDRERTQAPALRRAFRRPGSQASPGHAV